MKSILKILTIIAGALLALILTRVGISYLVILIALGLILSFFTGDKKSAIISGVLYATISYIISYPSGLFLKGYMPNIDIPVNVSPAEVTINLFIGLIIPIIITIVICGVFSIIGGYVHNLIKNKDEKQEEEGIYFDSPNEFDEKYENKSERFTSTKTKNKLEELSPIQKAKNRRKFEKE